MAILIVSSSFTIFLNRFWNSKKKELLPYQIWNTAFTKRRNFNENLGIKKDKLFRHFIKYEIKYKNVLHVYINVLCEFFIQEIISIQIPDN